MKYVFALMLSLAVALSLAPPTFAFPVPAFRTVAVQGEHAPGTPTGANFSSLSQPTINDSGQVAFSARLALAMAIVNSDNDSGVWSEGAGPLALLAREGDPAPTAPATAIYTDLFTAAPILDNSGKAVWRGNFRPTPASSTVSAIWSGNVGSVAPVAIGSTQAPGLPNGATYNLFDLPVADSQGQIGFISSLAGATGGVTTANNQAIWITQAGNLSLAVRKGDQAPGTPIGNNFQTLANLRLNDSGQIAFSSTLNVIDDGTMFQTGVWSTANGALEVVARDGIQAPGTPVGTLFNFLEFTAAPAFNSAGQVAFRASLVNTAVANNEGVWSQGSGDLALVARKGDQAPQTPVGAKFNAFNSVYLNNSGHTTFLAALEQNPGLGVNFNTDDGIWSDASGGLSLIAREGNQAPGVPTGTVFSSFFGRSAIGLSFNDFGHFAFASGLTGSGVTFTNDSALWAQDASGMLQLIVREGDLFEVRPGVERTISSILLDTGSGGSDGLARSFNNDYELVFRLFFTDGTNGIFTALVNVPEPAAGVLLMLAFASVLTRRERRG